MGKSRCNTFLFYTSQVHSSHLKVFKLRRLIFTLLISGCLKVGHRKHGRTIKPLNQCAVIDLNISATTQSKEPPNGWSRERRSVGLCAELLNATRAPHSHSLLFFRRPRGSTLGPRPCDDWWRLAQREARGCFLPLQSNSLAAVALPSYFEPFPSNSEGRMSASNSL